MGSQNSKDDGMRGIAKSWESAAAYAAQRIIETPFYYAYANGAEFLAAADEYVTNIASGAPQVEAHFRHLAALALTQTVDADISRILDLIAAKQHDYGHDNINRFGVQGIAVRLSDKVARLKNLQRRRPRSGATARSDTLAANESVEDSWSDIVGYCIVALMVLEGAFDLPLRADAERIDSEVGRRRDVNTSDEAVLRVAANRPFPPRIIVDWVNGGGVSTIHLAEEFRYWAEFFGRVCSD